MAKKAKKSGTVSATTTEIDVAKAGEASAFSAFDAPLSASLGADDEELKFCERAGAIPPVHPPEFLARLCESSTAISPILNAIATNVDGHGHQLESVFGSALTDEEVETAILYTREVRGDFRPVTKQDIESLRWRAERGARIEKLRMNGVLSSCCPGPTNGLTEVRKKRRRDLLGMGNAYLEVVRCTDRTFGELNYLRAATMRLRHVTPEPVEVPVIRRLSALVVERTTRRARFRTFVQFGPTGRNVFFKEYGDPRAISMHDGKVYESYEELRALGHRPATEVVWSSAQGLSARTAYGLPPWVAADAVVIGLRQAQVVNADHFSEKAIPQLVVLVNGAAATAKMVNSIREHFRQIRGVQNYHRVLILSAVAPLGAASGQVSIDIRPLRQAIPDDALFQKYEMNAAQTIRSQYRVAKLLLGLGEDVNRATSEAVLRFSEEQVFGPLRQEFDDMMNDILADEGYRYWRFKSNSPVAGNPLDASKLMVDAAGAGAVSINQILEMQGAIDNRTYARLDEPWADMPLALFKGLVQLKKDPSEKTLSGETVEPTKPAAEEEPAPTSPEELDAIRARLQNHPRREQGVELDTAKGRTLVMMLPQSKIAQLLAA
jgi:PBSX family phage portal protein